MTLPFQIPFLPWMAWAATFFCMVFSARVAAAFLQKNPRLFTVMALSALAWALLLPYYGGAGKQVDLLPAFNGVLCVYIGGLLILEHHAQKAPKDHGHIVWIQNLALVLLCTIAAPSVLQFAAPGGMPLLTQEHANMVVVLAIDALGFLAIAVGVWNISRRWAGVLFALLSAIYFGIELHFDWDMWSAPANSPMPPNYSFGFAACKVIYTLVFSAIVAGYGMPQGDREAGPLHWLLRLGGLVPARSRQPRSAAPAA